MGGAGVFRPLWSRYYVRASAIIWFIDGNDKSRIGSLRDEFTRLLTHPGLS